MYSDMIYNIKRASSEPCNHRTATHCATRSGDLGVLLTRVASRRVPTYCFLSGRGLLRRFPRPLCYLAALPPSPPCPSCLFPRSSFGGDALRALDLSLCLAFRARRRPVAAHGRVRRPLLGDTRAIFTTRSPSPAVISSTNPPIEASRPSRLRGLATNSYPSHPRERVSREATRSAPFGATARQKK